MGRSCRFKHRSQRGCLEEVKCEGGFGGRDEAVCFWRTVQAGWSGSVHLGHTWLPLGLCWVGMGLQGDGGDRRDTTWVAVVRIQNVTRRG